MNLNVQLKDITQILGNVVHCDADEAFAVHNIASLATAGPNDIAFVFDRGDASVFDAVSHNEIKQSLAGIIVAQHAAIPEKTYLIVPDVLAAFECIVQFARAKNDATVTTAHVGQGVFLHSTAVVELGAVIGDGAFLGAHVFVGKRCQVGKGAILHPGVKLLDECTIGEGSIIHAGTIIGSDGFGYQVSKQGLRKIPQIGIVQIGRGVEIGANCTLDRAAFGATIISDGVKMDNGVHIAHGVTVGPACAILAQTCIGGGVRIGIGCQIGGQVAIKDHVTIGNGAKIVSKSAVMNDLKDGETVAGIPAIPFNQWKRLIVCLNKLPDMIKNFKTQSFSGATKSWWQRLFQ